MYRNFVLKIIYLPENHKNIFVLIEGIFENFRGIITLFTKLSIFLRKPSYTCN